MLERLLTKLGERGDYDAASQCSRCGFCEQSCPTYVATGRESFSPRGRNQLVRLLIEGKLQDPRSASQALSSCLLCGACSTVCPAHVPTADLVLEGRRLLAEGENPWAARAAAALQLKNPKIFSALLKTAHLFKRLGFAELAARLGLLRLFGLRALEEAASHINEAPLVFFEDELTGGLKPKTLPQEAAWSFLTLCGTNFLFPRVGRATLKALLATRGPGTAMENPCCGLTAFNYGSLDDARAFAKANIERFENSGLPESAPLVGDCSSCVAHLKSYPQLFLRDPDWRVRAERFSSRVKDLIESIPPEALRGAPAADNRTVTVHDSCRARNGQGLAKEPRAVVSAGAGSCLKEMEKAGDCCGGAGAFAFVNPELSEQLLRSKVDSIAKTGARTVIASSTSCLLQLARGVKVYYPECRVAHLSEWACESLGLNAREP